VCRGTHPPPEHNEKATRFTFVQKLTDLLSAKLNKRSSRSPDREEVAWPGQRLVAEQCHSTAFQTRCVRTLDSAGPLRRVREFDGVAPRDAPPCRGQGRTVSRCSQRLRSLPWQCLSALLARLPLATIGNCAQVLVHPCSTLCGIAHCGEPEFGFVRHVEMLAALRRSAQCCATTSHKILRGRLFASSLPPSSQSGILARRCAYHPKVSVATAPGDSGRRWCGC